MASLGNDPLLAGKDEIARSAIAHRVGECLTEGNLNHVERHAAEALARALANDAIERVRREFADSVRRARHLPRDIALRIAHDIDSVACPFLEVTEVFSESDWLQLVLTVSQSARAAIAARPSMSEPIAVSLAELGDLRVAVNLVKNPATPMSARISSTIMDRFTAETLVLDLMAQRTDLVPDIVVRLTTKVSAAAREKLARCYKLPDFTEPLGIEAEVDVLLGIIKGTPAAGMLAFAQALEKEGKLSDLLICKAAGRRAVEFLTAALSVRSLVAPAKVRIVVQNGGPNDRAALLNQAGIPRALHDKVWSSLAVAVPPG